MEQSAVEFLAEKIWKDFGVAFSDNILQQAKEMEKKQIMDAYDVQWDANIKNGIDYYEQTFKK